MFLCKYKTNKPMLLCKYKANKQNIKHTNPCPRCHGLAPPGPVLATKKSKKLQRKRRRTYLLLVFIIFVGSFSNPSSVLRITEMVVDFNSRIPTYLAKIFLGNELSISCQKLWQYNSLLILIIRVCLTKSHSIFSAFSRSQAKEATEAKEAKDAIIQT